MEPKITVVMSAYNHEKYVEKAIQSVLNQTYKNIYFCVADDASSDNTANIIMKYEEKIDEIHLYDTNSGHGRWMSLILNSKTEYTAVINSDDWWENTKLEKQLFYLEKHPECAACFTWCNEVEEDGSLMEKQLFQSTNKSKEEWMYTFLLQGNCLAHPSILIRTEIYQKLFSDNNSVFRQLPDFNMWIKLVQEHEIYVINEMSTNFLHHSKGQNMNVSTPNLENSVRNDIEMAFIWYTAMKNMDDKYFKKAFKKVMVNPNANSHIEILCEKYFVLCTSSLLGVQMAAINYYYDVFQNMENYEILKQKYAYTNKLFHEIDTKIGNGAEIIKERELRDQSLELLKKMQSIIKQNGLLE